MSALRGAGTDVGESPQVVFVTTFYPNTQDPTRTVFVENLARALRTQLALRVIAPVPYAPPLPRWRSLRDVARIERRHGIVVEHPRYVVVPRTEWLSGLSFALAVLQPLARLAHRHPNLLVHAHCAYPDAVGVSLVARLLGLRYVVTCHGSDLNVYSHRRALRGQIRWALRHARRVIAVSSPLRSRVLELLGSSAQAHCSVVPCAAVDPAVFHVDPDREGLRRRLGLACDAKIVVSIGKLVPIKGLTVLIEAWAALGARGLVGADDALLIIGTGPEGPRLRRLAMASAAPIRFLGPLAQADLAAWLRAANLLCLPSLNEGTPNVVIEALASGRPVVASRVGAVPEFVHEGSTGMLVQPGEAGQLADALERALDRTWPEQRMAESVAQYSWQHIAQANAEVLRDAARQSR
jgi:glycosyltransferase involved in cell wall biosynthesis